MPVGGDIIEITYNHPDLGTGTFYPKADEDGTFDPGGFRSADEDTNVDGAGNMIDVLTAKRWSVETTISWDMSERNEEETLLALQSSPKQADYTFTHINGTVWGGKGKPVGDIAGATKDSTLPVKFAGGGKLKKIS